MKNQLKIYIFFSLLIFALFSTSCSSDINCIKGKGGTITQTRQVDSFSAVEAKGSFRVNIFQDSSIRIQEVTISAEENIIDLIETRITGQSLVIGTKNKCYTTSQEVIITIRTPALSQIVMSGSGDIILKDSPRISNLELILDGSGTIQTTPNFPIMASTKCTAKIKGSGNMDLDFQETKSVNTSISGSGNITLRGKANESDLSISGSGNIKAFSLQVIKSKVNISGSGKIEVFATDTNTPSQAEVDVKISGSGNVFVKGNAIVDSDILGSGKVERVD